jgi:hypothetical protein
MARIVVASHPALESVFRTFHATWAERMKAIPQQFFPCWLDLSFILLLFHHHLKPQNISLSYLLSITPFTLDSLGHCQQAHLYLKHISLPQAHFLTLSTLIIMKFRPSKDDEKNLVFENLSNTASDLTADFLYVSGSHWNACHLQALRVKCYDNVDTSKLVTKRWMPYHSSKCKFSIMWLMKRRN